MNGTGQRSSHGSTDALARIASLRMELEAASTETQAAALVLFDEIPRTPSEKVKLFRSLFRGRPDVFPTRFVARRTGKPGYAPACANEFKPGLCVLIARRSTAWIRGTST